MNEDDLYRTSSQYRYWSFTPEALASLRANTNSAASARVKAAIKRDGSKATGQSNGNGATNGAPHGEANGHDSSVDVECLTVEEEAKFVRYYCTVCLQLSDSFDFPIPIHVKATAVQYIKRFYLTNSPMTYHPKQIIPSALFLATKTENYYIALTKFARGIKKTSEADILAPEFIITQALRFTFDVRHPHRALKGVIMELGALSNGTAALLPQHPKTSAQLKAEMAQLPRDGNDQGIPERVSDRINRAYELAKGVLGSAAILTDAYFLYTPSQICFAALYMADAALTLFYLSTKFPDAVLTPPPWESGAGFKFVETPAVLSKLLRVLEEVAGLLAGEDRTGREAKEELRRIDKKLYQCRNPEKMDLVGLNRAVKRDGAVEGEVSESAAKRRKVEREKERKEGEDLFGGDLKKDGES
ncbi:cyclin-like protein [Viridothelium virens]|uniref:RNA polymerase II holoenzyme cyclin-like subunit n=1 Tax=Viridothelium virens TaxID=1048519 RepID=A0A6A6HLA5_VIRVR|nr:cyclin-like protein [Viridothelium virens]